MHNYKQSNNHNQIKKQNTNRTTQHTSKPNALKQQKNKQNKHNNTSQIKQQHTKTNNNANTSK